MTSLPAPPLNFARRNERGLIEIVCMHTGQVLCVQSTVEDLLGNKMENLVPFDTPQGKVYLERGLGPGALVHLRSKKYNPIIADLICREVQNGDSLARACEKLNLDYADICKWRRDSAAFGASLEQAKKDRAENFHDKVIDTAIDSNDPELKIKAFMWGATKGDSEQYGDKTKISGDKNAPVTFVISTGIQRAPEKPETKDVPSEPSGEISST